MAFSKRVDSKSFDTIRRLRNTLIEILRKQQSFILNSKVLQIPPDMASNLREGFPDGVEFLDKAIAKELLDSKRLQRGDLRGLLDNYLRNVNASAKKLIVHLPPDSPARLQFEETQRKGAEIPKYVLKEISSDAVELVVGGGPAMQTPTMYLNRYQGRWIPKEFIESFDSTMQQLESSINLINPQDVQQALTTVAFVLNAPLNNLKNAKSQEEFDRTLGELAGMAAPVLSMMGPGGAAGLWSTGRRRASWCRSAWSAGARWSAWGRFWSAWGRWSWSWFRAVILGSPEVRLPEWAQQKSGEQDKVTED